MRGEVEFVEWLEDEESVDEPNQKMLDTYRWSLSEGSYI